MFIKKYHNVKRFRHICENHEGEVPDHYTFLFDENTTKFANRPVNYQKSWLLSFAIAHTQWKKQNKISTNPRGTLGDTRNGVSNTGRC